MATSAGKIYDKAACKYCSAEISVNSLERHQADCANASDELREERKRARASAENRRLGKAPVKNGQRKVKCKFCHDEIGAGSIAKHEKKCEYQTPTEREYAKQQRQYQASHYDREKKREDNRARYVASMRVPSRLDEPVVPDRRHTGQLNANGQPIAKPMSVTMLVDEDNLALALGRVVIQKLPELLPQLIPGLTIEAFATKGHRAGKV